MQTVCFFLVNMANLNFTDNMHDMMTACTISRFCFDDTHCIETNLRDVKGDGTRAFKISSAS